MHYAFLKAVRPACINISPLALQLVALFTEAPLAVISALHGIATPKQTDASATAIFKAFGCQGTLLPFVFKLAEWDVNNCDSEQLLFRRNRCDAVPRLAKSHLARQRHTLILAGPPPPVMILSLSTKLITMSLKTYGQGYLQMVSWPSGFCRPSTVRHHLVSFDMA